MHRRRSVLYVPTNHQRAVDKAPGLDADVLIYDLEDAVLAEQKSSARQALASHLSTVSHQSEVVVRINSVKTADFHDDIAWLESIQEYDALLLPKVTSIDDINLLQVCLEQINVSKPVWILVETVEAVLNLSELVKALEPNAALILGAQDLAVQMRINHTPGRLGLLPILTTMVLHGRQAGLNIIDSVFANIEDHLGFQQSCEQARNLGFDGKTLIHPNQIVTANKIFSPGEREIQFAKKVIAAWNQKPEHSGIAVVDGKMIEQLHVQQAREILQLAAKLS